MTYALALDSQDIALELHRLLEELDPSRWRAELTAAFRARLDEVEERVSALLERSKNHPQSELAGRLDELLEVLRANTPTLPHSVHAAELRADWMAFRSQLVDAYESLSFDLEAWSIHVPSLRPTNYSRNLYHLANGVTALVFIELLLRPRGLVVMAALLAALAWTMELGRRRSRLLQRLLMALFKHVMHPHERLRVNSATWYATALLVLALSSPPMVCALAVTILALADPAAAIVGRRWGRISLINGRSLEGSATFFAVGSVASFAVLSAFHGGLGVGSALMVACGASALAAVAELVSKRIDDNFTIPLSAAAGATLVLGLLGRI